MDTFISWLSHPLPWYISGPLIGCMVPLLLLSDNLKFGISSSFRHICTACLPKVSDYFRYDWKSKRWSLFFVSGAMLGGFIAGQMVPNPNPVALTQNAREMFQGWKLATPDKELVPMDIFNWNQLFTLKGFILVVIGGLMVGFGTRYANGCTSGHSITGLSLLRPESLLATVFFFLGGLLMSNFLLPLILHL